MARGEERNSLEVDGRKGEKGKRKKEEIGFEKENWCTGTVGKELETHRERKR